MDQKVSPVFREQAEYLELVQVCMDILKNACNELYLSMRFLDTSLASLIPTADMNVHGAGTDGGLLYFEPYRLASLYRKSRVHVNRLYLHMVFHCLFCYLWTRKRRDAAYWNLACDIAVEALIDSLHYPCIRIAPAPARLVLYEQLHNRLSVLNAEGIYRALQEMALSEEEVQMFCREFWRDDHSIWQRERNAPSPRPNPNQKNDWDEKREKMQTEMEAFARGAAEDENDLKELLSVENRERYDYRNFLRKFSVLRETLSVDTDAFDYIFYHYGMELYGNMPLIEPLETKELRRVEDFVIVIDTSMSCSGELVKRFLEETCAILSQSESFFKKVNIHIIQCDDAVRQDVTIENEEQMKAYMERLELLGMGGTDFRPAFAYVDEMVRKRRFKKLRGLLYFTDGYGTFPVQMPLYDTAFVFMRDQYTDVDVPPWAMKVILDEEQLESEAEEIQTEVGNDEY